MKNRNFILMVAGQIISIFGSALLRFALSLYVLDLTGRADVFAGLYAVSNIPMLLTPFGGVIADRFNRRNLMVIYDFMSSTFVFLLFGFMMVREPSVFIIGAVMCVLSVITAMYTPTVNASIPLLVTPDKIESGNGIVTAVQALSGVAAPVMGGILYKSMGMHALVIGSGTAFFLSAVMEIFIRMPHAENEQIQTTVKTLAADMKTGFVYIWNTPFILKSMVLAALLNLLITPLLIVGAPVILRVTMNSSDNMYGIGMGLINFASVLGALTIGFFTRKLAMNNVYRWLNGTVLLLLITALAVAPLLLSYGYYPAFLIFMAGIVPIAMILTILSIFVISKVQKMTPNENLGKVMAIMIAVSQCTTPVGQAIYGVIFERFQLHIYWPLVFISMILLVIAVITKYSLKNETDPVY